MGHRKRDQCSVRPSSFLFQCKHFPPVPNMRAILQDFPALLTFAELYSPLPVPHLFPSQLWPPCSVWLTPCPPPSLPNHLSLQDQNTLFLFIYPAAVSVVSGSQHCNMEGHAIHGKSLKLPILVVTNIHTINKYIPWPFAPLKTTGPGDGRNDIVGGWYRHPGLNQHWVCMWSGRRGRAEDRGCPRAARPDVFQHCAEMRKAETRL